MKIKLKITLWVGLLFAMIILLSVIGSRQVNILSEDTKNILTDNYNTLDYSCNMLIALDGLYIDSLAAGKFRTNLEQQLNNVTENGEREVTDNIKARFDLLASHPRDSLTPRLIRNDLNQLMRLNMDAIQRKSKVAEDSARNATIWILATGTLCFLIAFVLLINLPGNIADPIKELTESIKAIAAKNYSQRVHFEEHTEFRDLARAFNIMAEKLEEYSNSSLSKILFEKKRIDTVINNMHDPIIGLDEHKKILFVNDEALKIIGMKRGDLVGFAAQDIAVNNDLIRSLIRDLIPGNMTTVITPANGKPEPMKIYSDGKESYFDKEIVSVKFIPTGEKEEVPIGDVIILKNITSFKELDFAKNNFIAIVSHELKTPISSIKLSLQLLENQHTGPVNEDQRQLIGSIRDDSNRLLKITSELLNMSQVETGNMQLTIQQSDPLEILSYVLGAVKVQATQKGIELRTDHPDVVSPIMADSEKTAWVLTNLITNAIRYSYDDTVVYIGIRQDDHHVYISVRDTGQGIAPQYQDKIFDKYFRVPGSQKEGTGLGLSISKQFIEAQGGQLSVESDYGAGTTFTMALNRG